MLRRTHPLHYHFKAAPARAFSFTEPLNAHSIIDKVRLRLNHNNNDNQAAPPRTESDVLLFRDCFSRLLFFDREDVTRELDQAKKQQRGVSAVSHKNVPGMKARPGFQALPFASLMAPPLLPFPVRETLVWSSSPEKDDGPDWRSKALLQQQQQELFRLSDYFEKVAAAQDFSHKMLIDSGNGCKDEWFRHSVGVLTATHNQIKFVVGDVNRSCLLAPAPAMRLDSTEQTPERRQEEHRAFIASFWSSLEQELLGNNALLDNVSVLWYRTESVDPAELFANNDVVDDDDDAEDNNKNNKIAELLRRDARWLKLPAKVAKGKKAKFDTDSLLRDLYIGQLNLF